MHVMPRLPLRVGALAAVALWTSLAVASGSSTTTTTKPHPTTTTTRLNAPPIVTSTPALVVTAPGTYAYDVETFDPDGDALMYLLLSGPDGMTIDMTTGMLRWPVTVADAGRHPVRIRVKDTAGNFAEQEFTVTVKPAPANRPPEITSTPPTSQMAPGTYMYDVEATDPDEDALTYGLVTAPAGMTLDPVTGKIAWPVTADDVGTHTVRVRVRDGRGGTDEQEWALTVTANGCSPSSCGNGRVEPECGEVCDGDEPCGSPSGAFARCADACRRLDDDACRLPAETCGNCLDDDANGLTDFEDLACCAGAATSVLTVTRGVLAPRGNATRMRLRGTLGRLPGFAPDPLRQAVYVQIRQPRRDELLCAWVPAERFMQMGRNRVAYWAHGRPPESARGIVDLAIDFRPRGDVRFTAVGRRVQFRAPATDTLRLTVGFLDPSGDARRNRCAAVTQSFQTSRAGLRAR